MMSPKAMQVNGVYIEDLIDGYTTIDVTGRESLETEMSSYSVGKRDGEAYNGKRYKPRTISVTYCIENKTDYGSKYIEADITQEIFKADRSIYIYKATNGPMVQCTDSDFFNYEKIYISQEQFEEAPTKYWYVDDTTGELVNATSETEYDEENQYYVGRLIRYFTANPNWSDASDLLLSLRKLNDILNVEEAEFIFDDEPDVYYVGTLNGRVESSIALGLASGTFSIQCSDPFKYSTELTELEFGPSPIDGTTMVSVDYDGTYPAKPEFEVDFYSNIPETTEDNVNDSTVPSVDIIQDGKADASYVAIVDDNNHVLQFGNPDIPSAEVLLSKNRAVIKQEDYRNLNAWDNNLDGNWNLNNSTIVSAIKSVTNWDILEGEDVHIAALKKPDEDAISNSLIASWVTGNSKKRPKTEYKLSYKAVRTSSDSVKITLTLNMRYRVKHGKVDKIITKIPTHYKNKDKFKIKKAGKYKFQNGSSVYYDVGDILTAKKTRKDASGDKNKTRPSDFKVTKTTFGKNCELTGYFIWGSNNKKFTIKSATKNWIPSGFATKKSYNKMVTHKAITTTFTVNKLSSQDTDLGNVVHKFKVISKGVTGGPGKLKTRETRNLTFNSYTSLEENKCYLTPTGYGTNPDHNYTGPVLYRRIPKDAEDPSKGYGIHLFKVHSNLIMSTGNGVNDKVQTGGFCCFVFSSPNPDASGGPSLPDSKEDLICGFTVNKTSQDNKKGTITAYWGSSGKKIIKDVDLSYSNVRFGKGTHKEKKKNVASDKDIHFGLQSNGFYFSIGHDKENDNEIKVQKTSVSKDAYYIVLGFFSYAKEAGSRNHMDFLGIQDLKVNAISAEEYMVSNLFQTGDVLIADTDDASVYLNGLSRQDIGALGNDWDNISLRPGENNFVAQVSMFPDAPSTYMRRCYETEPYLYSEYSQCSSDDAFNSELVYFNRTTIFTPCYNAGSGTFLPFDEDKIYILRDPDDTRYLPDLTEEEYLYYMEYDISTRPYIYYEEDQYVIANPQPTASTYKRHVSNYYVSSVMYHTRSGNTFTPVLISEEEYRPTPEHCTDSSEFSNNLKYYILDDETDIYILQPNLTQEEFELGPTLYYSASTSPTDYYLKEITAPSVKLRYREVYI